MQTEYLTGLKDLFLNLATDEVFPNLYRNCDLLYFEADRLSAAQGIEEALARDGVTDIQDAPYIRAAREVAQKLKAFDQASYAELSDSLKEQRLQDMVDFYVDRFALILDGTDFAGKPMNVREYVTGISKRTYTSKYGIGVPNSLNIVETIKDSNSMTRKE